MRQAQDAEWIRGALARYERPLLRFALQLVGPGHAADIVQETFLTLCKTPRGQIEARLAPWLFTVCKNRAIDVRRSQTRALLLGDEVELESPSGDLHDRLEQRQSLSRVGQIVERLPERQRQALILRFSGGLSYREIAEVMELTVVHVGVILHQAIRSVRASLGEDAAIELQEEAP